VCVCFEKVEVDSTPDLVRHVVSLLSLATYHLYSLAFLLHPCIHLYLPATCIRNVPVSPQSTSPSQLNRENHPHLIFTMDKLKSIGSKIKFPSTPGEKISKAFKFDRKHNVLSKPNDPFMDGPMLEDVRSYNPAMFRCQQEIMLTNSLHYRNHISISTAHVYVLPFLHSSRTYKSKLTDSFSSHS